MRLQEAVLGALLAISPATAMADGGDQPKKIVPKKRDWTLEDKAKLSKAAEFHGAGSKIYKMNASGKQSAEGLFKEAIDSLLQLEKEVKHNPAVDLILAKIYTVRDHPSKMGDTQEAMKTFTTSAESARQQGCGCGLATYFHQLLDPSLRYRSTCNVPTNDLCRRRHNDLPQQLEWNTVCVLCSVTTTPKRVNNATRALPLSHSHHECRRHVRK